MSDNQNSLECNTVCWAIAAFFGVVSMVMLYLIADFSALQAIFTGGLMGALLGVILSLFVCRGQKAPQDLMADEKPAQRYAREAAEEKAEREAAFGMTPAPAAAASGAAATSAPAPAAAKSTSAASATPAKAFEMQPDTKLDGQKELSERKGEWKYESGNDPSPTASAAPAAAPAAEPAPAPAAKAEAAPAASSGDAPTLYTSASDGPADDLKRISGVGPKLEQTLNEMGIWYFKQVAAWGPSDIAWVDDRLRFKGRIERDDWMSQAKILAEGGETEFSKKKKK